MHPARRPEVVDLLEDLASSHDVSCRLIGHDLAVVHDATGSTCAQRPLALEPLLERSNMTTATTSRLVGIHHAASAHHDRPGRAGAR